MVLRLRLTVLLAAALLAVGCTSEAPTSTVSGPLLTDADAVLDSLLARWNTATEGVARFTLVTEAAAVEYARTPEGAFVLTDVDVRNPQANVPIQYAHPDYARIASLLRGRATLLVDRTTSPPRYRLAADSTLLAEAAADPQSGLQTAPVAASVLVEAGTYHLREVHTRNPLPQGRVDSALVDLRIAYGDYQPADGVPIPRVVSVTASGLLEALDATQLLYNRTQYQMRQQRLNQLPAAERAVEEAELADLGRLLTEGVSSEEIRVDSVAIEQTGAAE